MRPKLAALVASCLFLLGVSACGGGSSADPERPLPELTPFSAVQTQRLHEIRNGIAALRELPAVPELREGSISREQWREYSPPDLEAMTDEDRAEIEFYNQVWRVMRLIGPDDDLFEASTNTSGSTTAGFYSIEHEALVLVNSGSVEEISLSEESTIAHEYVHSFQDQRFDLGKVRDVPEPEDGEFSELGTTIDCVMEGDASIAEEQYMLSAHGPEWESEAESQDMQNEAELAEMMQTLSEIPRIVLLYAFFNYTRCPEFVAQVQEQQGWQGVDLMYADPPTTTEQVLHVEKYFSREAALEIPDTDLSVSLGKVGPRAHRCLR